MCSPVDEFDHIGGGPDGGHLPHLEESRDFDVAVPSIEYRTDPARHFPAVKWHANSRSDDKVVGEVVGNGIVERLVDTRYIDDDSGNLRHGTYESTQSVMCG